MFISGKGMSNSRSSSLYESTCQWFLFIHHKFCLYSSKGGSNSRFPTLYESTCQWFLFIHHKVHLYSSKGASNSKSPNLYKSSHQLVFMSLIHQNISLYMASTHQSHHAPVNVYLGREIWLWAGVSISNKEPYYCHYPLLCHCQKSSTLVHIFYHFNVRKNAVRIPRMITGLSQYL